MRSSLVYGALNTVQNRYALCQVASKTTRKFHRPHTRVPETTNEVLGRIAHTESEQVVAPEKATKTVAQRQRRAA
jgi:hypothetical protein